MNLDIIKQILMSDDEYWVLARKSYTNRYGKLERGQDDLIFVAIPYDIPRGLKYEEITLVHIEKFDRLYLDFNIYLNSPYAPFQKSITFYDVHMGFPVTGNVRAFINEAISVKKDYYQLKELIAKVNETENVIKESV